MILSQAAKRKNQTRRGEWKTQIEMQTWRRGQREKGGRNDLRQDAKPERGEEG